MLPREFCTIRVDRRQWGTMGDKKVIEGYTVVIDPEWLVALNALLTPCFYCGDDNQLEKSDDSDEQNDSGTPHP